MIVAVERGLSSIKERLGQAGYKTVYADEYRYPVDAYIYSGIHGAGRGSLSMLAGIGGSRLYSAGAIHGAHGGAAVVEINASEKSFEEIELELCRGRRADYF